MRILCHEQGNAEWLKWKTGRIGGSRIRAAMRRLERASNGKKAGDWHGDHDVLVHELCRELITGKPAKHNNLSFEMQYGLAHESEARDAYQEFIGEQVKQTGWVGHPNGKKFGFIGCSPDGYLRGWGLEIKVPTLKEHIDTMLADVVPEKYVPQMQLCMLVCELPEWEYVSFSPPDPQDEERFALPEELRLWTKRLKADYDLHRKMEDDATATIEEAVALVQKLSQSRHLHFMHVSEIGTYVEPQETLGSEPIF